MKSFPFTIEQFKWIEALEGGKYKQTRGVLQDTTGFCCLGVACDIYQKEVKGSWGVGFAFSALTEEDQLIPLKLVTLLSLRDGSGTPLDSEQFPSLWAKNDAGDTFHQIAQLLRDHPEQYFTNLDEKGKDQ